MLLVDHHQPVRAGLQSLLATVDDIQVVGEAIDGDEAIDAGAVGYLLKDADPQDVVRGVRAAANGESPISGKVAHALMARGASAADRLTPREREVLSLVAEGMSNRAITLRLDITEGTVKGHLTKVYQRIGVLDRAEAARWARRNGLAGEQA